MFFLSKFLKFTTLPLLLFNVLVLIAWVYFLFQNWKIALGFIIAVILIVLSYSIYMIIPTIILALPMLLLKRVDNKIVNNTLVIISALLNFIIHAIFALFMFYQGLLVLSSLKIKSTFFYCFALILIYFVSISGVESLYYKEKTIVNAIFTACFKFSFLVLTIIFMWHPIELIPQIIVILLFGAIPFVLCSLMDHIKDKQ